MRERDDVAAHYTGGNLLERLNAALRDDGVDPERPSELGNALSMPFADASFDGAYSMNVSMNIADKRAFYREIHRVLEPGGWLVLSEVAKGEGGEPGYPTPWAASASTSFLSTPEETRRGLLETGFDIIRLHSTREQALEFGARSRAMGRARRKGRRTGR